MAHDIWKDDITLFFKGCRTCWSYKVLKFAFVADIAKFDPDKAFFRSMFWTLSVLFPLMKG